MNLPRHSRFIPLLAAVVLLSSSLAASGPASTSPPSTSRPARPPSTRPAVPPEFPFSVQVTGNGPPILLIPGLACSGEVWTETVAKLSPRYECHVLTLGGFAGEPTFEGPFLETIRDGIVRYIAKNQLRKPAIIGHSIGGYLTFLLGIDSPDSVGPLISVDGLPSLAALTNPAVTAEQATAAAKMMDARFSKITREMYVASQNVTLDIWLSDPARKAAVAEWGAASDPSAVGRAVAGLMRRDLRAEVAKIMSPVLLIGAPAAFGTLTTEELQKRYSAQVEPIPNHTVAFALKSRHFIMYDQPEWLWTQIEQFLSRPQ